MPEVLTGYFEADPRRHTHAAVAFTGEAAAGGGRRTYRGLSQTATLRWRFTVAADRSRAFKSGSAAIAPGR